MLTALFYVHIDVSASAYFAIPSITNVVME